MRDVILKAGIPNPDNEKDYLKIQTVKSVKEILGLGLLEAKTIVDNIPIALVRKVTDEEAGNLIKVFVKEGMKIEVKDSLTGKLVYPTKVPDFEEDSVEEVKILKERIEAGENSIHEETPNYWIMGTPDRGNDVYDLLHDKDSLLQSKTDVNKQMLENPSRLLLINSNHEINAIDIEDNASLVNLITKNWTELKLPWKPKNKELIWAWDKDSNCRRVLLFYDAENNCCFSNNGTSDGPEYDHYAPFEGEWPQWAKDAIVYLED